MEVLSPRCAGLDVHKATVMAGVRIAEGGQIQSDIRQFATTTPGLLAAVGLADGVRGDACRDGGDGRVLEAGLACAGRRLRGP